MPGFVSHDALAVVTAPLVIATMMVGLRGHLREHRQLARLTFPMWVYVSVTGVVISVVLHHAR